MTTTTEGRPLGFLLKRLDGLIDERFERTVGELGISRRQWQILSLLAERPSDIEHLAETLAPFLSESPAVHVDPLESEGFVRVERGTYRLTDAGRERLALVGREVAVTRRLVVQGLSEGEYGRTVQTLLAMIRNLENA